MRRLHDGWYVQSHAGLANEAYQICASHSKLRGFISKSLPDVHKHYFYSVRICNEVNQICGKMK